MKNPNHQSVEKKFNSDYAILLEDLTIQERKVLRLTISDCSCKEIAEQLYISDETVKKHRKNIIKKFQVSGKVAFRRLLRQLETYLQNQASMYTTNLPEINP